MNHKDLQTVLDALIRGVTVSYQDKKNAISILKAELDKPEGEPVAVVVLCYDQRNEQYHRDGEHNEIDWLDEKKVLKAGTHLYTHPAPKPRCELCNYQHGHVI
jgi:hypothetical protein